MKQNSPKIWLLGAALESYNMGVRALAESTLKCIFTSWPTAEVILEAYDDEPLLKWTINNREVYIKKRALFFCKNVFKPNNSYVLLGYAFILKLFPLQWLGKVFKANNSYFKELMEADLIVDITGGDSFSDIYGMKGFINSSLHKLLFILCSKNFVLLPQTYGPFKSNIAKAIAQGLLSRVTAIYCRDLQGLEEVSKLIGKSAKSKTIQFMPDVAFVLDPEKPDNTLIEVLEKVKINGGILVGLNISGLLYNLKHLANESFGLKGDYRRLVCKIIRLFMKQHQDTTLVLVPHVYANSNDVDSDPNACEEIYQKMVAEYPERILLVKDKLNHKQLKYLIGCCDFFLGSRMHSCIAAISQCVPTVGLAYSGKFIGVFESAGLADSVADLRTDNEQKILTRVNETFAKRYETAKNLNQIIPQIQDRVLQLFNHIDTQL